MDIAILAHFNALRLALQAHACRTSQGFGFSWLGEGWVLVLLNLVLQFHFMFDPSRTHFGLLFTCLYIYKYNMRSFCTCAHYIVGCQYFQVNTTGLWCATYHLSIFSAFVDLVLDCTSVAIRSFSKS